MHGLPAGSLGESGHHGVEPIRRPDGIALGQAQGRFQERHRRERPLGGLQPRQQSVGFVQATFQQQEFQHGTQRAALGAAPVVQPRAEGGIGHAVHDLVVQEGPGRVALQGGRQGLEPLPVEGLPADQGQGVAPLERGPVVLAHSVLGRDPLFRGAFQEGHAQGRHVAAQAVQQHLAGTVGRLAGGRQGPQVALAVRPAADPLAGALGQGPEALVGLLGQPRAHQQVEQGGHGGRIPDPGLGLRRELGLHERVGQVSPRRGLPDGAHGHEERLGQGMQLIQFRIGNPKNRHPIRVSFPALPGTRQFQPGSARSGFRRAEAPGQAALRNRGPDHKPGFPGGGPRTRRSGQPLTHVALRLAHPYRMAVPFIP